MNCYVCATKDIKDVPAVALCRHCDTGLCLSHLRIAAATQQAGGMNLACTHDTWTQTVAAGGR
jgi:hypothetical protein